jgi:hypothetical protein
VAVNFPAPKPKPAPKPVEEPAKEPEEKKTVISEVKMSMMEDAPEAAGQDAVREYTTTKKTVVSQVSMSFMEDEAPNAEPQANVEQKGEETVS